MPDLSHTVTNAQADPSAQPGDQQRSAPQMPRTQSQQPDAQTPIDSYSIAFSATGSEYFRIWIVNVLLIIVTCGLYLPWAKVRKLKYFYNNTRLDDHSFDFHGNPWKMLRGLLITGAFFAAYSQSWEFAPAAGLIGMLALLCLAPLLFRAAMRFRLGNTSWRGLRFRFVDTERKELYWSIVPGLLLVLLPGALSQLGGDDPKEQAASMERHLWLIGVLYLAFLAVVPYFFWRLKSFQHNHYAWGSLQSEYRSPAKETYKVFGWAILVALGLLAGTVTAIFSISMIGVAGRGLSSTAAFIITPIYIVLYIALLVVPRAVFTSRMQNLLWSRTGNTFFRFKSFLEVGRFVRLQFKNYALILVTIGFYWPFAVVATKRMQLEAIELRSRIPLDNLRDESLANHHDAAGDMAADIFGIDVGF
jgi:uncharacterized membrane protein YjgN (DUF898 family)